MTPIPAPIASLNLQNRDCPRGLVSASATWSSKALQMNVTIPVNVFSQIKCCHTSTSTCLDLACAIGFREDFSVASLSQNSGIGSSSLSMIVTFNQHLQPNCVFNSFATTFVSTSVNEVATVTCFFEVQVTGPLHERKT